MAALCVLSGSSLSCLNVPLAGKMSHLATPDQCIVLTTPKRNELLKDGRAPAWCQVLGRGSFGTVFKGIYKDHSVAVKIIRNATLHNESHLLNLRHRNIVRLIKVEATTKFGLIIMECPKGHCLQRLIEAINLPLMHRVIISLDVLNALSYCHAQKVLHLDVKPANILVVLPLVRPLSVPQFVNYKRSYLCKLCDFGSSIELGQLCESQAQAGCARGTLRYMSPEALRSLQLSPAADIYSLAITMWQLQSRHLPYHTLNCNEAIAYQVVKEDLRPNNYAKMEDNAECHCLGLDVTKKARRKLNFKRKPPQRFVNYFDSPEQQVSLESAYSDLYKSCWVSLPESRLNAAQLKKRLELIMAKISLDCKFV